MPPKRAAPTDTATTSKKFRSAIDESLEEFLCPITQGLPLQPVFAEDGKVYERDAIETWLKQNAKSPVLNTPMGTKLVPATQIKNMIERMVKTGALDDAKVKEWQARIDEQEKLVELRNKAEAGDAASAYHLGRAYDMGSMGLSVDASKAFDWYLRAANAGHAHAMGRVSTSYSYGKGVASNEPLALRWAAAGDAQGSTLASGILGQLFYHGGAGLPIDMEQAFKFRLKSTNMANSQGMYNLAMMYADGEGTSVDIDEAAKGMRKAVQHNNPERAVQQARDWLGARGLAA